MVSKIHVVFILVTATVVLGLKLEVDGKMDFGPNWNYEYHIKPLRREADDDTKRSTVLDNRKAAGAKQYSDQPQFIDIIIKNNKSNPRLIQVAEAHIFDAKNSQYQTKNDEVNDKVRKKELPTLNISEIDEKQKYKKKLNYNLIHVTKEFPIRITGKTTFKFSDEHTEPLQKLDLEDKPTKTGKHVKHLIRLAGDIDAPKPEKLEVLEESHLTNSEEENGYRATRLMPESKKKRKRHRVKPNETKISKVPEIDTQNLTKHRHHHHIKQNETQLSIPIVSETIKHNSTNHIVANPSSISGVTVKTNIPPVTSGVENIFTLQDIYVRARLIKDDPKIKEFTRHIYEQSIKTIQSIKEKLNNYEMKKEADRLMKSYEERFGDFVRETQNQKIKTRDGSQKVILNTLDTSNRILDRLVNYMIGDMDKRGILRNSGTENVIQNELNKKKDLENKHLCTKIKICPTEDSFTKFCIDVLQGILRSTDNQIIEIRDALTEVLKNTDFSDILYETTQKRFQRAISDIEKYKVDVLRPIFLIMKNILSSKNAPIQVVGREDARVNKTLAFLEMIESWEKILPPNERNVLEWTDMRNSFREWSLGKRKDTVDLMQHFTDHVVKAISKEDARAVRTLTDRNLNIMLGY